MGGQEGGPWRTLRVSDWRLGGKGHPWCHRLSCLTPRKISWKFCVDIFIRSVSRRGVLHGGTWRTLRVPEQYLGGQGHPWCHGWSYFTPRNIPWKFCVDIFIRSMSGRGCHGWCCFILRKMPWKFRVDIYIRSMSGMGGQEGGDFEDFEGSWL